MELLKIINYILVFNFPNTMRKTDLATLQNLQMSLPCISDSLPSTAIFSEKTFPWKGISELPFYQIMLMLYRMKMNSLARIWFSMPWTHFDLILYIFKRDRNVFDCLAFLAHNQFSSPHTEQWPNLLYFVRNYWVSSTLSRILKIFTPKHSLERTDYWIQFRDEICVLTTPAQ